jgi:hypothetical protein
MFTLITFYELEDPCVVLGLLPDLEIFDRWILDAMESSLVTSVAWLFWPIWINNFEDIMEL